MSRWPEPYLAPIAWSFGTRVNVRKRDPGAENSPATPPAEGERRGMRGYMGQYDQAGAAIYSKLECGHLLWIGVVDRSAGIADDLVLGFDGLVIGHHFESSTPTPACSSGWSSVTIRRTRTRRATRHHCTARHFWPTSNSIRIALWKRADSLTQLLPEPVGTARWRMLRQAVGMSLEVRGPMKKGRRPSTLTKTDPGVLTKS